MKPRQCDLSLLVYFELFATNRKEEAKIWVDLILDPGKILLAVFERAKAEQPRMARAKWAEDTVDRLR